MNSANDSKLKSIVDNQQSNQQLTSSDTLQQLMKWLNKPVIGKEP